MVCLATALSLAPAATRAQVLAQASSQEQSAPPAGEAPQPPSLPVPGAAPATGAQPSPVGSSPPESTEERVREAEEEATRVRRALAQVVVREKAGILLRRGFLQIEPSFAYTASSRDRLDVAGLNVIDAVFIGVQDVEQVERTSYTSSVGLRYGIFDDLQIGLSIPYTWNSEVSFRPEDVERVPTPREVTKTLRGGGLGDMNVTLSYHFFPETRFLPDLVASLGWKTKTGTSPYEVDRDGLDVELPTGSGHYSWRTGVSFVKASEPAIIFGSAGYTFAMPEEDVFNVRSRTSFSEVDPGDTFSWSLGLAFSLNWNLSLRASIDQSISDETEVSQLLPVGRRLREFTFSQPGSDSNATIFSLGATYALGGTTSLDVNVGIGLTRDAPDVILQASLPYTINANEYVKRIDLPRFWRP